MPLSSPSHSSPRMAKLIIKTASEKLPVSLISQMLPFRFIYFIFIYIFLPSFYISEDLMVWVSGKKHCTRGSGWWRGRQKWQIEGKGVSSLFFVGYSIMCGATQFLKSFRICHIAAHKRCSDTLYCEYQILFVHTLMKMKKWVKVLCRYDSKTIFQWFTLKMW